MKRHVIFTLGVACIALLTVSHAQETENSSPVDPTKSEATVLRQRLAELVAQRTADMSVAELRAEMDHEQERLDMQLRKAKEARERAAKRDLFVAVEQLRKTVIDHKGTEAADDAQAALAVLGYTIWKGDNVYFKDTQFIGDYPFIR